VEIAIHQPTIFISAEQQEQERLETKEEKSFRFIFYLRLQLILLG
jgi:hypothetical protein